jgi:hypothetical protein
VTRGFVGLDLDAIAQSENEIDALLERLAAVIAQDIRFVGGVEQSWSGADASAFVQGWRGQDRPAIDEVVASLTQARDALRANRLDQTETSSAGSGLLSTLPNFLRSGVERLKTQAAEAHRARQSALAAVANATHFKDLSNEQYQLLLRTDPERLLNLKGIPELELKALHERVLDQYRDEIPVHSIDARLRGEVDVWLLEFSAEVNGEITTFADGSVLITLGVTGGVGAELDIGSAEVGAGVEAGAELEFRFSSEDEAQSFIDGLKSEMFDLDPRPNDVAEYLMQSGHLEAGRVSGGVYVEVEADVFAAEGELRVAGGGTYDWVSGETSTYLNAELTVEVGEVGSLAVDAELEWLPDNGHVDFGASISGHNDALSELLGLSPDAGLEAAGGFGAEVWVEGEIDLNDPEAAAAWNRFTSGEGSFAEVVSASELVVGIDQSSTSNYGFDFGVAEVEAEISTNVNVESWVKPPHADSAISTGRRGAQGSSTLRL